MSMLNLPFGIPLPGGPVDRPLAIPDMPGFGSPPAEADVPVMPSTVSDDMPAAPPVGMLAELPDMADMPGGMPSMPQYIFSPQVTVTDKGAAVTDSPVAAISGAITDDTAENLVMTCDKDNINGIHVSGGTKYLVKNANINFVGDGANDFEGIGACAQVTDTATLIIEDSILETTGVIRPCTMAGEYSTLIVRNSKLIGNGGVLPPGSPRIPGPGMKEPPAGLGIGGNCRTHLSAGDSHSYFYDSTIYADGWAALSTDACYGDMYLEANNCDIICKNSGYATFCDHGGNVVINNCRLDAELGTIVAGKCRERLDHCTVTASKNLALMMSVFGNTHEVGELTINGGSADSQEELIRIKSQNTYIDFRGTVLRSRNGVIIHSYLNDDPCATKVSPGEILYGIKAVFSDMNIQGDFLHEDPERTMALTFKHTNVSGRIENAIICLDLASTWVATADSHVFITGYGPSGVVDALPGVTIYARSDKRPVGETTLPSGGKLIITA